MKRILFSVFAIILFASCRYTTGSGNIISETRSVSDFDGISVAGDFEVEVKTGPASVVVEADDNIMKYIETTVSANTLKIRTEDLHNYSNVHMKVFVTVPALKKINAAASAEVQVKDVLANSSRLTFKASSGSGITARVDAPAVESDASSGATINLSGRTKSYTTEASSGSSINSADLLSENTTVKASSGSTARVHASVAINITASSGSSVTYHGAGSVNQSVSSGATVVKKD